MLRILLSSGMAVTHMLIYRINIILMPSVKILYHFLVTNVFYRPTCIKMGKRVIICNPILITNKALKLGSNILIRDFARLEGVYVHQGVSFNPVITLDDGVVIEQNLHLTCANKINIGKDTSIAANVTITDIIHPYEDINVRSDAQPIKHFDVEIGEACKIYNNAVILPGTTLGKHCVVGANSVVLGKRYDDYSIITGAPAKVTKRYSAEKGKWLKTDADGGFI